MQRLTVTPEAHQSFEETGVCIIELTHDEVAKDEQYEIGFGNESVIVVVVTTQKPTSGQRSHVQLAVLMDVKYHIG
jgi:hypothetical protein